MKRLLENEGEGNRKGELKSFLWFFVCCYRNDDGSKIFINVCLMKGIQVEKEEFWSSCSNKPLIRITKGIKSSELSIFIANKKKFRIFSFCWCYYGANGGSTQDFPAKRQGVQTYHLIHRFQVHFKFIRIPHRWLCNAKSLVRKPHRWFFKRVCLLENLIDDSIYLALL